MKKIILYSPKRISQQLPNFVRQEELLKNKKILFISPHSDDISIAFGAFASALAKKNRVLPLLFFSGFRGLPEQAKEAAIKTRQKEMRKEAQILGLKEPVFLNLASYEKRNKQSFIQDCQKTKQLFFKEEPEVIFLPKKDDNHPSHKLATKIALSSLKEARIKPALFFYENPWSLFKIKEINALFVPERRSQQAKERAIKAHPSQLARTDFLKASLALSRFRASTLPEQLIFGFGKKPLLKMDFCEVFQKDEGFNL